MVDGLPGRLDVLDAEVHVGGAGAGRLQTYPCGPASGYTLAAASTRGPPSFSHFFKSGRRTRRSGSTLLPSSANSVVWHRSLADAGDVSAAPRRAKASRLAPRAALSVPNSKSLHPSHTTEGVSGKSNWPEKDTLISHPTYSCFLLSAHITYRIRGVVNGKVANA